MNKKGKFKDFIFVRKKDLTNGELHVTEECVPDNTCYKFKIVDRGENGLCCEDGFGYYRITLGGIDLHYNLFQDGRTKIEIFHDINSDPC